MGFFSVVRFNCGMISDIKQAGKCCAVTQSWVQALSGWGREAVQMHLHHCSVCGHHYMAMLVCSKDCKSMVMVPQFPQLLCSLHLLSHFPTALGPPYDNRSLNKQQYAIQLNRIFGSGPGSAELALDAAEVESWAPAMRIRDTLFSSLAPSTFWH